MVLGATEEAQALVLNGEAVSTWGGGSWRGGDDAGMVRLGELT